MKISLSMRMVNICAHPFPSCARACCKKSSRELQPLIHTEHSLANNCNYYFMTTCLLRRAVVCPSLLVWHSHGRGFEQAKSSPAARPFAAKSAAASAAAAALMCAQATLGPTLGSPGFACPELCSTHIYSRCAQNRSSPSSCKPSECAQTFSITVHNFITIHDGVIKIGPKALATHPPRGMIKGRDSPPQRRAAHQISQPMWFGARTQEIVSACPIFPAAIRFWRIYRVDLSEYEFCDLTAAFCRFSPPVGNFVLFDLVNLHAPLQKIRCYRYQCEEYFYVTDLESGSSILILDIKRCNVAKKFIL